LLPPPFLMLPVMVLLLLPVLLVRLLHPEASSLISLLVHLVLTCHFLLRRLTSSCCAWRIQTGPDGQYPNCRQTGAKIFQFPGSNREQDPGQEQAGVRGTDLVRRQFFIVIPRFLISILKKAASTGCSFRSEWGWTSTAVQIPWSVLRSMDTW
jgi:hypothetical protein